MVKINSVKFGEIKVSGKDYFSDVIIYWDGKVKLRIKSHIFGIDEFLKILKKGTKRIVIGTGVNDAVRVTPEVFQVAEDKGIKIFLEESEKAAEIFNAFIHEKKKVIGVIHTTC